MRMGTSMRTLLAFFLFIPTYVFAGANGALIGSAADRLERSAASCQCPDQARVSACQTAIKNAATTARENAAAVNSGEEIAQQQARESQVRAREIASTTQSQAHCNQMASNASTQLGNIGGSCRSFGAGMSAQDGGARPTIQKAMNDNQCTNSDVAAALSALESAYGSCVTNTGNDAAGFRTQAGTCATNGNNNRSMWQDVRGGLDDALKVGQLGMMGLGLMNAMNQANQKSNSGVSAASPTPTPTPQKVDMGKSKVESNKAGFGADANGASFNADGKKGLGGAEGFTPFTMPKDFEYDPPPTAKTGNAGESGVSIAAPGGPGGGGGTGSANGTGASRMGDAGKDAGKEGNEPGAFEIPNGGGGRSTSFVGLKSKGDEFSDLNKDLGPLDGGKLNSEFGSLDNAGRDIASVQGGLDGGINPDDGTSLFSVIGNKLKEMKKRGSI